jgi:hypothetical protein
MGMIEEKIKEVKDVTVDELENKTEEELKAEFDALFEKRTKGLFDLAFNDPADVKKLLNILSDKAAWKGNEAISLVTVYENIRSKYPSKLEAQIVNEGKEDERKVYVLQLEAHAIESCNYFLGKHSSNGYHSAKEYLDVAVPVLRIVSEFQKIETKLQQLSSKTEELRNKRIMGEIKPKEELKDGE